MNITKVLLLICVAILAGCNSGNDEMAQTPFERYPHSDYYDYPGYNCIDSMINDSGNPVFVFQNIEHIRYFVELEDTFVIINGYLAPEPYYTPEENIRIMKNLKFYKK